MGRSQVFGDDQVELLAERLCGAIAEQSGGGMVPAPDCSCSICKDHGIGDLFEDRFSQEDVSSKCSLFSGSTSVPSSESDPALQRIDEQGHGEQVGTSSGAQAPGDECRMHGSGPRAPVRGANPALRKE
jgi:hypothetical protein